MREYRFSSLFSICHSDKLSIDYLFGNCLGIEGLIHNDFQSKIFDFDLKPFDRKFIDCAATSVGVALHLFSNSRYQI